jgi:N-acetylglucosaminyl-diphospho-decaprenol L-rhamnosyltransferase
MISISIVSHGQFQLLRPLLGDLEAVATDTSIEIIITRNIPEIIDHAALPRNCSVRIIENDHPLGFGHNHNNAFAVSKGKYYCVMNPDIRLQGNPFLHLMQILLDERVAIVAPKIVEPGGGAADSVRPFPTLLGLVKRFAAKEKVIKERTPFTAETRVDWIAGMFLMFRSDEYATLGGFDRRYFLYCEDVDICARAWKSHKTVVLCPQVKALHEAQRTSHKKLRYFKWHLVSYLRYFAGHFFQSPRAARCRTEEHLGLVRQ